MKYFNNLKFKTFACCLLLSTVLFAICYLLSAAFLHAQKAGGGMLPEVLIKAKESRRMTSVKPPLDVPVDRFETIRSSLLADQSMFTPHPPGIAAWRRNHPEFLYIPRVIEPWRTIFGEHSGITFYLKNSLYYAVGKKLTGEEAREYSWSLTVVDEDGKAFQSYDGASNMPDEIFWSGRNEKDLWLSAGHSYSAISKFTDPSGVLHTGQILSIDRLDSVAYQQDSGYHIELDSLVLFGPNKLGREIARPKGEDLMRAVADFVKRRYFNIPVQVTVFSRDKELAIAQALAVKKHLLGGLMYAPDAIVISGVAAPYSEQRSNIIFFNR